MWYHNNILGQHPNPLDISGDLRLAQEIQHIAPRCLALIRVILQRFGPNLCLSGLSSLPEHSSDI